MQLDLLRRTQSAPFGHGQGLRRPSRSGKECTGGGETEITIPVKLTIADGRQRLLALCQYYVLVTLATLIALYEALFRGIEPVWERAEGTR